MWGSTSPDFTNEPSDGQGTRNRMQRFGTNESPRSSPTKSATTTASTCTPLSPGFAGDKPSLRADAPAFEFSPPQYGMKRPSFNQGGAYESPHEFAIHRADFANNTASKSRYSRLLDGTVNQYATEEYKDDAAYSPSRYIQGSKQGSPQRPVVDCSMHVQSSYSDDPRDPREKQNMTGMTQSSPCSGPAMQFSPYSPSRPQSMMAKTNHGSMANSPYNSRDAYYGNSQLQVDDSAAVVPMINQDGYSSALASAPRTSRAAAAAGGMNRQQQQQQGDYMPHQQQQPTMGMTPPKGPYMSREPQRQQQQFQQLQQPQPPPIVSADGYIYQVHFKRAHRNFVLSPMAPHNIVPGDFVKVEADRGEDLGVVVSKTLADEFVEFIPTAGYRGRGFSSGSGEKKYIVRLATQEERLHLRNKVEDEERALQVIREKVVERRLPMAILDAEYQFDRHKLVFFFEADRRIDFRELVSDLFSLYKTRIWMQQVDTSTIPNEEIGLRLAHAAGFLPSSYALDSSSENDTGGGGGGGSDSHAHNGGGFFGEHSLDELTQSVSDYAAGQGLFGDSLCDELSPYQSPLRPQSSPRNPNTSTALSLVAHKLRNVSSDDNMGSKSTSRSLLTPVQPLVPEIDDLPSPSTQAPPDDSPFPLESASMGPLLNGTWAFEGL